MVYQEHTRRWLRAGLLLLSALGLLSLGFGIAAPSLAPDLPPMPVAVGEPTRMPKIGPFGGTLALYGASTEAAPPNLEQLGCRLQNGAGRTTQVGLSEQGAASLDRRVVDGRALLPLLRITAEPSDGDLICDGTGADSVQPLYLITTIGQRDLVPMAAFSFAALALALGIAGAVAFRPIE